MGLLHIVELPKRFGHYELIFLQLSPFVKVDDINIFVFAFDFLDGVFAVLDIVFEILSEVRIANFIVSLFNFLQLFIEFFLAFLIALYLFFHFLNLLF